MQSTDEVKNIPKPSIFTCKTCKATETRVPKEPKAENGPMIVKLEPAKLGGDQKYTVKIGNKQVSFGAKGYGDFTIIKDDSNRDSRRDLYISRHEKREKQYWNPEVVENLYTASFWSRYLLWEKRDIFEAIQDIQENTGIEIKFTKATIEKHQKKLAKAMKKLGEDID